LQSGTKADSAIAALCGFCEALVMEASRRSDLPRPWHVNQKARVSNIEFFFDLVFALPSPSSHIPY